MATDTTKEKGEGSGVPFYDDLENLKKLCDFLRSKNGPPVREALLMEKRVHYLKGKYFLSFFRQNNVLANLTTCFEIIGEKLVNFMFEPKKGVKWPKKLPKFESRQDAIAVCKELCKHQFLLRSEKRGKGDLGVSVFVSK
jgi:translocation protein SEC62